MPNFLIALCIILLTSCFRNEPLASVNAQQAFKASYDQIRNVQPTGSVGKKVEPTVTLTSDGVPLVTFLRAVSDQTSVSVIAASDLDKLPVTMEFKNIPVSEALGAVARRLGKRLTKIGQVYFLGDIGPEDRGVLVRRVNRLTADGLQKVLDLFRSEFGHSQAFGDGLVVVADRVEILDRIDGALNAIELQESPCWVVQLYIVSVTDRFKQELGIDLANTVKFSWDLNTASGVNNATASGTLNALLVAAWDSPEAHVISQPLLLVRDGATASLISGENVPIPKKNVSNEGNVQTVGFEHVQTGLTVKVGVRDDSVQRAHMSVFVEYASITGYLEFAPITRKQSCETDVSIQSGGVYLVGALADEARTTNISGSVLPSKTTIEKSNQQLQIYAKVFKIGTDFRGQIPVKNTEKSD